MSSRFGNLCVDSFDPYAQTMWWSQVLTDYVIDPDDEIAPGDPECGLLGPDGQWLLFLKVPESKTVKNRTHICLRPVDRTRDEEVERLVAHGATILSDLRTGPSSGWVVLADPEGNEFCVLVRLSDVEDDEEG